MESHGWLMSIPSLSAERLAEIKTINVKVDMTTMPSMGAVMEATFQVSGAYKAIGATDKAFLITPSGYTVTINSADRTGTIAMGSMGTFPIVVSDEERRLNWWEYRVAFGQEGMASITMQGGLPDRTVDIKEK